METFYKKTAWKNLPETSSPINARNLNKIEDALETLDNRTVTLSQFETNFEKENIDFDTEV